jgi:hypothetical protein
MPTIIVRTDASSELRTDASSEQDSTVMLSENVQPEHLASNHHAAQLIERVGWAVTDAKNAEDIGAS